MYVGEVGALWIDVAPRGILTTGPLDSVIGFGVPLPSGDVTYSDDYARRDNRIPHRIGMSLRVTNGGYGHRIVGSIERESALLDNVDNLAETFSDMGRSNGVANLEALWEADERIRTADPFITSEVLYQLSYVGVRRVMLAEQHSGGGGWGSRAAAQERESAQ